MGKEMTQSQSYNRKDKITRITGETRLSDKKNKIERYKEENEKKGNGCSVTEHRTEPQYAN